jgi:endogenous inhibitor of DNA gyrase (YacG/DUF329 family)
MMQYLSLPLSLSYGIRVYALYKPLCSKTCRLLFVSAWVNLRYKNQKQKRLVLSSNSSNFEQV